MKKTIFVSIFQSFVARSVLNTNVFKKLRENKDNCFVIFSPDIKKDFYEKKYGGLNVIVQSVNLENLSSFSGGILHKISIALLPTYFVKYRQKIKFLDGHYLSFFANAFITCFLAPLKWARWLFRFVDRQVSDTILFDGFFKNYNPDLVFAADIFNPADAAFLLSAKNHNVRTIGMVRSWDCAINKNLLRVFPEKIIANNENVKNDLVKYHDAPKENIEALGFPQFDPYINEMPDSREEFLKKIGANPKKHLVLFAPAGSALSDIDWQYCEILKDAVEKGDVLQDIHVLIRVHPQDTTDLGKFEKHPSFTIDRPGITFNNNPKATEVDTEAVKHLINSIYHSELVITVNTSLVLDAVIFDKPQIMLGFDGYEKRPFLRSVRRYQKEDNMLGFIKTGAVRVVENPEELTDWINKYLKNPQIDSENRAKARKEILMSPDGKAGERIANFVLNFINPHTK